MTTPPWSPSQPPSHPTQRRIRLRREFEDSVVAARFEDVIPADADADAEAFLLASRSAARRRTAPQAATPAQALGAAQPVRPSTAQRTAPPGQPIAMPTRSRIPPPPRRSLLNIAGWSVIAVLALTGAWAATIAIARLVWKFSGS